MSKPAVNEQGTPVRRGAYDYETKRGKLQDVNQDQQVSFADTWIGDMLGMDGQGGVQGPSMRDSMGGARRRAIEVMQAQGVPMTQANLARAMGGPGGAAAPSAQPSAGPPPPATPAGAAVDEEGNPVGPVAAAAAAGGAAYVAKRMLDGKPLKPDADGNVLVVVPGGGGKSGGGGTSRQLTAQQAADEGWAVTGLNYPDGGNALPKPPNIDMIDGSGGDIIDGTATEIDPNASRIAVDPATAPISTEDVMTPSPGTAVGTVGGDNTRYVQTSVFTPEGSPVYSDNVGGGFVTRGPAGNVIAAPTMEALQAAIRAAIR